MTLFQSSPGPKAGCNLELSKSPHGSYPNCFNPHPARRPGATLRVSLLPRSNRPGFNPHPARRPGATRLDAVRCQVRQVSILTRPEGRVQLNSRMPISVGSMMFQSSPGPKAGCNLFADPHYEPFAERVSILTRPEGRVQLQNLDLTVERLDTRFNPHPARRPGATIAAVVAWALAQAFQSSPGPKAGCNISEAYLVYTGKEFQSSPGPKAGCN